MFSRTQSHIARKQHKCSLCGGVIEKGEQYIRYVIGGYYDIDFSDDKYHTNCFEFVKRDFRDSDHDIYFDASSVIDDIRKRVCRNCRRNAIYDMKAPTLSHCNVVIEKYRCEMKDEYDR